MGSEDLAARLKRVESRNVTYLGRRVPFWTDAQGVRVRDATGRSFLDLTGAFGVAFAGHRHPRIMDRIARQAERLVHGMGDVHPPAAKVAFLEALAARMPWPETRIVLGLTGSDAVEAAFKTAHLATGRAGIVAFEGSYHGLSLGALAATHRDHFRRPFVERLAHHVRFLPFPTSAQEAERVLERLACALAGESALGDGGRPATADGPTPCPVGAVILEPIQGRAGVRTPPAGFARKVAERTRAAGALLIADEVFTGMGRTGDLLVCGGEAAPDLLCLGKPLGGGLPLSACCGPAEVMDAWPPSSGEAVHTSTFLGHPLACAAGLGFLETLDAEGLAARAARLGKWTAECLRNALAGCGSVKEVRGRGLLLGVELDGLAGIAARVAERGVDQGVIVLPAGKDGRVVQVTPPATIRKEELEEGVEALAAAVRSVSGSAG